MAGHVMTPISNFLYGLSCIPFTIQMPAWIIAESPRANRSIACCTSIVVPPGSQYWEKSLIMG